MLPRSERTYIGIIIIASLVMVVFGIVGVISGLSGKQEAPPRYESAPSPKLVSITEASLVTVEEASRPPISDAEFQLFHHATRTITPKMATDAWRQALAGHVAGRRVLDEANAQVQAYLPYIRGAALSKASHIDVSRPKTYTITGGDGKPRVVRRTQSAASVTVALTDAQGRRQPGTLLSVTYTWQRELQGDWKIVSVDPSYHATAGTAAGPDRSVDQGENPADALGG